MKTEQNTIDERLGQIESEMKQIKIMLKNILSNYGQAEFTGENLLNVKDVSSFLKVDSNFIYSACSKGELLFIKIGKSYRFKKEDILTWIEKCQDKKGIIIDDYVNSYLQKNILRG